jgi:hypothetical protein
MKTKANSAPAIAAPAMIASIAPPVQPILADYLSPEQLAIEIGVSLRTVARWHALRHGPPRVMLGRRPMYKRSSVAAWIERQERDPAAASAGRRRA